jgi:hypothetical protein
MNIEELRKQVPVVATGFSFRGELVAGLLLTAALICSLSTLVVENPTWLSLSAILLVLLSLLYTHIAERRSDA